MTACLIGQKNTTKILFPYNFSVTQQISEILQHVNVKDVMITA